MLLQFDDQTDTPSSALTEADSDWIYSDRMPQQYKGERTVVSVRIPDDQKLDYERIARELGIHLGTYVTIVMAEHHNKPIPQFALEEVKVASRRKALLAGQEELPIANAS